MKILVIKLRAIGDTVIWTAALASLREQFPDAEIHALTYPANVAVLENSKSVDEIHVLKPKSKYALVQALWRMRGKGFDWLLGFHATTSLCRWAWLAGASKMVLHHHSWAFTPRGSERINEPGALQDTITRDLEVLRAMGIQPQRKPTEIRLAPSEREWAENLVRAKIGESGGDPSLPRYVFLPGASHHLRRLPKELWLPLVAKCKREGVYQPLVMCDAELSQAWSLKEECAQLNVPLFDRGSLREFMGLVSTAQWAMANDSGPGHIAVALGLKCNVLFGPGCVGDWFPYDSGQHKLHRIQVTCRAEGPRHNEKFQFCTVDKCEHHTCMRKLTVSL